MRHTQFVKCLTCEKDVDTGRLNNKKYCPECTRKRRIDTASKRYYRIKNGEQK